MGDLAGWASLAVGQLVTWPQLFRLRCNSGQGVSVLSYVLMLLSMSLWLVHAVEIRDPVGVVSVPLGLVPNTLVAVILFRRRRTGAAPRAVARGACKKGGLSGAVAA
jgi:uncharacterized protein with PQ loop repeat